LAFLRGLPPEKARHAYAPGKWTVAELVGHVADSERVFAYRALCFARGGTEPQPGFDENVYAANAPDRGGAAFSAVVDDYAAVRAATLSLFRGFAPEAWERRGVANAKEISVRAQAWVIAGHERHHLKVLRERYL
ncbi:MAG TPA: DinB family protein, partial [Vicinamibacteria bacterium]|nr:DinB family protein [Vicinamibacteria bacterium]